MKTVFASLVMVFALTAPSQAALITGTTSKYYLSNYETSQIFAIQGTSVTDVFDMAYSGTQGEGVLAVTDVISTRSFYGGTLGDNFDGLGGTYQLDGTPTGTTYANDTVMAGRNYSAIFDGTSDGTSNYAVELTNSGGPPGYDVVAYDNQWQNPLSLFTLQTGGDGAQLSIAYDSSSNSLWIGAHGAATIWNYSMSGALLSSFNTVPLYVSSLGYDAADNTLWMNSGVSNYFYQYSTTGTLLQEGAFAGLPNLAYYSGEFASPASSSGGDGVPAPGALVLLGLGLVGLAARRRTA